MQKRPLAGPGGGGGSMGVGVAWNKGGCYWGHAGGRGAMVYWVGGWVAGGGGRRREGIAGDIKGTR